MSTYRRAQIGGRGGEEAGAPGSSTMQQRALVERNLDERTGVPGA